MEIDRNYIRKLETPFSEALPHGAYQKIRETLQAKRGRCSEHTPRLVLEGGWSDPELVSLALALVRQHHALLQRFLDQFPVSAPAAAKADALADTAA